jgi:hypothetical protein
VDLVNLAITETNQAYANSGINAELNLIHLHRDHTGYTDDIGSTSMSNSLYHLSYTAGNSRDPDGKLDYIHQMRTDVGADMVALITTGAGCGIAWLGGSNPGPGNQFSVTKYSCATGYYSFGHELGHNIGAHHDKGTTGACGSSSYNYGFRDPNGQYRSTLSYSCATGQCDNNPGGPCTRSPFYSTPDPAYLWNGKPMGATAGSAIGETNNARIINDRAANIAAFYTSGPVTPGPTQSPVTPGPTQSPTMPVPTMSPTKEPTGSPVQTVPKYMCANRFKNDSEICLNGSLAEGSSCQVGSQGNSCGNGGKYCQLADCPDTSGPTPPTPTPPSPTPPTGGNCSASAATCKFDTDCCSGTCNNDKGVKTCA